MNYFFLIIILFVHLQLVISDDNSLDSAFESTLEVPVTGQSTEAKNMLLFVIKNKQLYTCLLVVPSIK